MKLIVHEPPRHDDRVVASDPDAATVAQVVKGLPWNDITFVVLKQDDNTWLEGSGSLNPEDGLSARYSLGGLEHVSARPPRDLDELIALLQSYAAYDGRWRTMIEWRL